MWILAPVAGLLSMALTGVARRFALSHGILDVPNARSSHVRATPRGGGVSIVVVVSAVLALLRARGLISVGLLVALIGGGALVALVGLVDDRKAVPATVRLTVHLVAAVWSVTWLGGFAGLRFGNHVVLGGLIGDVLAVLAIVWTLNMFNFMDGIDGLAASEAILVAAGAALLLGPSSGVVAAALILATACAGFLAWNWPPARIFLGDVGSGYLGFVISVLAIASARAGTALPWVWLILSGAFLADATITLARRLVQGERVYEAHRSHAYQWLARRWRSHLRVTLAVVLLNLLWLLPCATLAAKHPTDAAWIAVAALLPVGALTLLAGAGCKEERSNDCAAAPRHQ